MENKFIPPQLSCRSLVPLEHLFLVCKGLRGDTSVIASIKYDGVRIEIRHDGAYSRNGLKFPNRELQAWAAEIYLRFAHEIQKQYNSISGNLLRKDLQISGEYVESSFLTATSTVKTAGAPVKDGRIFLFDYKDLECELQYFARLQVLKGYIDSLISIRQFETNFPNYTFPDSKMHHVNVAENQRFKTGEIAELVQFYEGVLTSGHEGIIVAASHSRHKSGRATFAAAQSIKFKPSEKTTGYLKNFAMKEIYFTGKDVRYPNGALKTGQFRDSFSSKDEIGVMTFTTPIGNVLVYTGLSAQARKDLFSATQRLKNLNTFHATIAYEKGYKGSLRFPRVVKLWNTLTQQVFVGSN